MTWQGLGQLGGTKTWQALKNNKRLQRWTVLGLLTFLRYLYCGFRYAYQLDDYIQYYNYRHTGAVPELIQKLGLLGARPLAGLADITVWTWFWGRMLLAVLLLTVLFVAAVYLLSRLFSRKFHATGIFAVMTLLCPANFEGVYWMSAASRVVVGFFFAALAMWLFDRYTIDHRWAQLVGMLLSVFGACCFYEQAGVVAAAGVILLALFSTNRIPKIEVGMAFLSLGSMLFYYLLVRQLGASSALYAGRTGDLIIPSTSAFYQQVAGSAAAQIVEAVGTTSLATIFVGFGRGIKMLFADLNLLWVLAAALLLVVLYVDERRYPHHHYSSRRLKRGMLFGVLWALSATALWFVMGNPWFSMRNAFFCLPGIALFVDSFIMMLVGKRKHYGKLTAMITVALAVLFMVASVSEMSDYMQTYQKDMQATDKILQQISFENEEQTTAIVGLKESYLPQQNYLFHEHIHGVTESNWALTGMLRFRTDNMQFPAVGPIALDKELYLSEKEMAGADRYYYADDTLNLRPILAAAMPGGGVLYYDEADIYAVASYDDKAKNYRVIPYRIEDGSLNIVENAESVVAFWRSMIAPGAENALPPETEPEPAEAAPEIAAPGQTGAAEASQLSEWSGTV